MDNKFLNGLLLTKKEILAEELALLNSTSFLKGLTKLFNKYRNKMKPDRYEKIKENSFFENIFNMGKQVVGIDELNAKNDLEENKKVFMKNYSEEKLIFEILIIISKKLKIKYKKRNMQTINDLEEICDEIVFETLKLVKKKVKEFEGNNLDDLKNYVIKKLIVEFEKINEMDDEKQDEIISKLEKNIKEMPDDFKKELKDKLEIDKINSSNLKKVIGSGTFAVALSSLVSIVGFPAYLFLTSSIASIAGVLGLTLPFGIYTGATSTLSIIASPLFFLPFVVIFGYLSNKKGKVKINTFLIPLIIFMNHSFNFTSTDIDIKDRKAKIRKFLKKVDFGD